jgi:hypothetical protein
VSGLHSAPTAAAEGQERMERKIASGMARHL